ncbi:E3 ubiquitin ligase complex SCF subunit sconC [Toxocara canis]|uniref:Skp1-related protein n=1 Tax=Toxocara canis TaxID=6265 RepID=A0A0B2VC88_TOXCA|nr:E3 ubiquitin ligase complex SCF subunit sconC [Toxocara canis]
MIRLQSSDGEVFDVDRDVIKMSATISTMLQGPEIDIGDTGDLETQEAISVLEWCEHHKNDASMSESPKGVSNSADDSWDAMFTNVDKEMLFELILDKCNDTTVLTFWAADALGIKGLLDAACHKIAEMIKDKTPQEIEHILTIEDDFTPEEEEQIRKEKPWPTN